MQFRSEFRSTRHHASFLIAWLLLSVFGVYMVVASEMEKAEQQFAQDIHELSTDIRQKLHANEAVLSGFSAFLQAVDASDQEAAARYAASALAPYPHIEMLEVARRISPAEQFRLEQSLRKGGQPNFTIRSFAEPSDQPGLAEAPSSPIWPIIFIFPAPRSAQEMYGIRLESVPYLAKTLRRAPQANRALVSPVFQLTQGGSAYFLLRRVERTITPASQDSPSLFGSSMVALLLCKTTSLLPANLANKDIELSAELFTEGGDEPSVLFQHRAAPVHWLNGRTLPRFSQIIETNSPSQSIRLSFQRQLKWTDIFSTSASATVFFLLASMLLVAYSVRRHHRAIHTAAIEHERAEHQATHDALTGLPNRHLLTDRFDQALHRWQRHGAKFALFIIDLDHFKKINDSLGHEAGDAVLVATAARILQAIRASDTVARYGGDEFIVLIADVLNEADALALGEKLCDLIRQPVAWGKTSSLEPTCSLGIALCPDDGDNFNSLFQRADRAMYRVKKGGRNGALLATRTA